MLLTLGQARQVLWKYASNVPLETATDADTLAFDSVLNRLCERLLLEGKWRSTFKRVNLRTHGNTLTLPRNLDYCIGVDPVTSSWSPFGFPLNIYSRWFEFAASGPGLTANCANACAVRGLLPISNNAQTFADPDGTFYLRSKSTKTGSFTFIGGLNENGDPLDGNVTLSIINGTSTTTQQYTEMPFIEKSITGASVEIYSVDTTTAVETLLCVYVPSETVPEYTRYAIPNAQDGNTFACICKLKFVPAIDDTDIVIPSVTDALILGLMSFQFRDKNDPERSALYFGPNFPEKSGKMSGAVDVLDSDLAELTSTEIPMFQVSEQYGAGNIRSVR